MRTTETVDTVVVGAGHAGLAVSRLLTGAGREHVVLDRGRVGERWRTERWDSLHLLTPSWMTRLPGWYYAGSDPDGYLSARQLVRSLEGYARSFDAPVIGGTTVRSVTAHGLDRSQRYDVVTDRGTWRARNVVVATGPHGTPSVPAAVSGATDVEVVTSNKYRNPGRLAPGGVLVVGASSSGVQIADELARAGREVVVAVGRHTRVPRQYRGMDICWWLDVTGRLARTIDDVDDPVAARREPSLQLVGRNGADDADLDLATLQRRGVRLAGRLTDLSGRVATFADGLADTVGSADRRLHRLLDGIDRYVDSTGLGAEVWAPHRPRPVAVPETPRRLDLAAEGIGTVLLATGFTPDLGWLDLPVVGRDGWIEQYRGVTAAPGLYVVGQRFQHRRDSGFIDGARHDAHAVVHHLMTGSLAGSEPTPSDEEQAA
jgi:putative flavoprotein involved in K+ transport